MKIDLVITYVDNTNEDWQREFSKYSALPLPTFFRTGKNALRYLLRSVGNNLPFINQVFLVVQNRSEVPSYVDQEKVRVVTHNEFIPKQYLPTFNSTVIETFLPNIPTLSERFIYTNDDIFVINQLSEGDFYDGDRVITSFRQIPLEGQRPTFYESIVMNSNGLILEESRTKIWENGRVIIPNHTLRPYFKSSFKECYAKYWDKVEPTITRFRTPLNYNLYIVDYYQKKIGRSVDIDTIRNICIKNDDFDEEMVKYYDTLCVIDHNKEVDIFENPNMQNFLNSKFKEASTYENG